MAIFLEITVCSVGHDVPIAFCLFVFFIYFTFWFQKREFAFDCSSSFTLLFYYNLYLLIPGFCFF